jgi:DNA repair protein RadC
MTPLKQVAEISISYNPVPGWQNQPRIIKSQDALDVVKEYFPKETIHLQENMIVLYLNQSNRVIAVYKMSTGGMTGTVVDIRLILATALKVAATGIILAHNHPSGNRNPSTNDIDLTHKIYQAAKLMDIHLLDHLIVTPDNDSYYSFADEGKLIT